MGAETTDNDLPAIRRASVESADGGYRIRLDLEWPEHPEQHAGQAILGIVGLPNSPALPLMYPSKRHADALAGVLNANLVTPG